MLVMKAFTYLLGRQWFSKVLNYIQMQSTVTGLHILMSELRPYIFDGPSSNDWPQSKKETNFVLLLYSWLAPPLLAIISFFHSYLSLSLFSLSLLHIHMNTFFLNFIFSKEFNLCNKIRILNDAHKNTKSPWFSTT